MKIKIEKNKLLDMLKNVSKVISSDPLIPGENGILLVSGGGRLDVMASNLQNTETDFSKCTVYEVGSVLVDAKYFAKVIKELDDLLIIEDIAKNILKISSNNKICNFCTMDLTTFLQ